jgi:hypothetical protein
VLDRARLLQANRPFSGMIWKLTKLDLITLEPEDVLASRVFREGQPDNEDELSAGLRKQKKNR